MAVKPGSLFPKHLLYLLAPSYQVGRVDFFFWGRMGCCDKFWRKVGDVFGWDASILFTDLWQEKNDTLILGERFWARDDVMYFPTKWGAVQNPRILKITGSIYIIYSYLYTYYVWWFLLKNLPELALVGLEFLSNSQKLLVICKDVVHLAARDQPNPTSRRECPSMINKQVIVKSFIIRPISHPRRIFTYGKTWTRHSQLVFGLAELCFVNRQVAGVRLFIWQRVLSKWRKLPA